VWRRGGGWMRMGGTLPKIQTPTPPPSFLRPQILLLSLVSRAHRSVIFVCEEMEPKNGDEKR
jgi:hypothetical protein